MATSRLSIRAPDELGAQRTQTAGQHAEVEPGQVLGGVGDEPHQRHGHHQDGKAGEDTQRSMSRPKRITA